jgi:hypothetical protein
MTDIWRVMILRPVFCRVLTCREWSLLYGDDCFGFERLTCALNLGTSLPITDSLTLFPHNPTDSHYPRALVTQRTLPSLLAPHHGLSLSRSPVKSPRRPSRSRTKSSSRHYPLTAHCPPGSSYRTSPHHRRICRLESPLARSEATWLPLLSRCPSCVCGPCTGLEQLEWWFGMGGYYPRGR